MILYMLTVDVARDHCSRSNPILLLLCRCFLVEQTTQRVTDKGFIIIIIKPYAWLVNGVWVLQRFPLAARNVIGRDGGAFRTYLAMRSGRGGGRYKTKQKRLSKWALSNVQIRNKWFFLPALFFFSLYWSARFWRLWCEVSWQRKGTSRLVIIQEGRK